MSGTTIGSKPTTITVEGGQISSDTELPSAALIEDGKSNPVAPPIDANISGFNGTRWDRIRTGINSTISSYVGVLSSIILGKYVGNSYPALNINESHPLLLNSIGKLLIDFGNPRIPRTVHAASATLPGAGAYTTTTAYSIPDGVRKILFYVTYTRGAINGQAKYKFVLGNGTESAQTTVIDQSLTINNPFGQQDLYLHEIYGPIPNSASAITFTIPYEVSGGETSIALLAAEIGVTDTPGISQITLTAQYI